MGMGSRNIKNAGYLLVLLPQLLLVVGAELGFDWMPVIFFFVILPVLRLYVGNDLSPPNVQPSPTLLRYLRAVPRLYCLTWAAVLPWAVWKLSTGSLTPWEYVGFGVSFWIVVSLNTAVAHELIHAGRPLDRVLGVTLDASVGYFHFAEEHLSHHARTGHYVGGDAAVPGTSIYRFAASRYVRTFSDAWRFETDRLRRLGLRWYANRLIGRVMIPAAIAAVFYYFAGWKGLIFYMAQVLGAAFSVQAITYLQHWGLSQLKTPELADYGFSWEDGCWMQACVTLNHAYHGQHHLNLRQPYYKLSLPKDALCLPASYPVMFLMALYPSMFTKVMTARLERWRADVEAREAMMHDNDCIGAARLARQLKKG